MKGMASAMPFMFGRDDNDGFVGGLKYCSLVTGSWDDKGESGVER
jgi:hypothetical protein